MIKVDVQGTIALVLVVVPEAILFLFVLHRQNDHPVLCHVLARIKSTYNLGNPGICCEYIGNIAEFLFGKRHDRCQITPSSHIAFYEAGILMVIHQAR